MNVLLRTEIFNKHGVSFDEVLYLIAVAGQANIEKGRQSVVKKGLVCEMTDGLFSMKPKLTLAGQKVINDIVLDSNKEIPKSNDSDLKTLVSKMRELFPKGYQQHNPDRYPWRGSPKEIEERMRGFFKQFGTDFKYEDILKATERYAKRSINDPYMKTLPYFIWSKQKDSLQSLLASELEVMKEGDDNPQEGEDWKTNVI